MLQEDKRVTSGSVSVVIPTLHRPRMLLRAIESVRAQTHPVTQIIVVVDGPDDETIEALGSIDDRRLLVVQNSSSLTAAGSRNVGVARVKSEWCAFLDDDDEWLPNKIERQLAFAARQQCQFVSCLSNVITPNGRYVWPEVIYEKGQRLDEYLFDRQSLLAGSSFVQTSSYMIKTQLYRSAPFRPGTPHDDWDFLLTICDVMHAQLEMAPEPLVDVYMEEVRPSLSQRDSWQASLTWIDSVRDRLSARAYSGFCLGVIGSRAARARDWHAFPLLLWRSFRYGRPRLTQLAVYVAFWMIPIHARRRLRAILRGAAAAA